jgi:hypothetical protein
MTVYQQAVFDGTISSAGGGGPSASGAWNSPSVEQVAWATYGAVVITGAVLGAVAGGKNGAAAGALAGLAGVALFGGVTWTG